jgi:hypothetical protein
MRKSNFACGSSDPGLLPVNELPPDWTTRLTHTQAIGNQWLDSTAETALRSIRYLADRKHARAQYADQSGCGSPSIRIADIT